MLKNNLRAFLRLIKASIIELNFEMNSIIFAARCDCRSGRSTAPGFSGGGYNGNHRGARPSREA